MIWQRLFSPHSELLLLSTEDDIEQCWWGRCWNHAFTAMHVYHQFWLLFKSICKVASGTIANVWFVQGLYWLIYCRILITACDILRDTPKFWHDMPFHCMLMLSSWVSVKVFTWSLILCNIENFFPSRKGKKTKST